MKRISCFLLAALLLIAMALPAAAAPGACFYDEANLLADAESMVLEGIAQRISQEQQCAVYFMTVEDYTQYGKGDIFTVAVDIYKKKNFGMGENRDGVLLMLSMAERDYCLIAHGFGDTALTDYGKDYISERFLDDFADDDWYGGCMDYLHYTEDLLSQAREGKVFDKTNWMTGGMLWLCSFLLAAVVSVITCLIQRAMMKKKVRMKSDALEYLDSSSVNITRREEHFSHSTVVRTKISKESNSGSSGGHSHSEGFSGKSGKF